MVKNLKDPNQPPRPLTAYFAWMKVNRAKLKAEHPTIKNKELTKKLGEAWSASTDQEKQPFIDTAKTQMDEWKTKMEAYRQTDEYKEFMVKKRAFDAKKKAKAKGKKVKPPKDPNAPKRPSTGFFLFVEEKRAEVKASLPPEQRNKVTLVTKKCGELWKDPANAAAKEEYNARAKKLKEQYKEEMAAYQKTEQYAEYQQQLEDWKDSQQPRARKVAPKVSRRLNSSSDGESSTGEDSS